jgi:hypothetical protein
VQPGPDLGGDDDDRGRSPRGFHKIQVFFFDGEKRQGNHRRKPIT